MIKLQDKMTLHYKDINITFTTAHYSPQMHPVTSLSIVVVSRKKNYGFYCIFMCGIINKMNYSAIYRSSFNNVVANLLICFAFAGILNKVMGFEDVRSFEKSNNGDSTWKDQESRKDEFDNMFSDESTLVAFAKSCLIQILHRQVPEHCINPQIIKSLVQKVGGQLNLGSAVENLEFFVGDDVLCYSYNLASNLNKENIRITKCVSTTEILNVAFQWLLTLAESKTDEKIEPATSTPDQYCFSPAFIKLATFFVSLLIGLLIYTSSILLKFHEKSTQIYNIPVRNLTV